MKRNLERGDLRAGNLTLEHCSNCAIESPPLKAKFRISRKTDDPLSQSGGSDKSESWLIIEKKAMEREIGYSITFQSVDLSTKIDWAIIQRKFLSN